jgi:hypothetical protein
VSGKYKGCTIISEADNDLLVISELNIFPNGMVRLVISEEGTSHEKNGQLPNTGFVKYITITATGTGKLFISLRYDHSKHYNSLSMFLTFDWEQRDEHDKKKLILRGGYAGESAFTKGPIASTVVFEQVGKTDVIKVARIPILNEARKLDPLIDALYQENRSLMNFFISDKAAHYSNHPHISMLMRQLAEGKKNDKPLGVGVRYDAFISIPLLSYNDPQVYENNARLALELMDIVSKKLGIRRERIFTAGFNYGEARPYTFAEYNALEQEPSRRFIDVKSILDDAQKIFFIYPAPANPATAPQRISSSIIELGYCLGRDKVFIILCDKTSRSQLPTNLVKLNENRIYNFTTEEENSLAAVFNDAHNIGHIKRQLRIQ